MLRIDDDLTPGKPNNYAPQYAEQEAPEHLETAYFFDGVRMLPGIRSWHSAVLFWKAFESIGQIDLVVSDVKFVDDTSPLSSVNNGKGAFPTPTGISHFKALAAIARSKGSPLGIGLHTADPTIWEGFWSEGDPIKKIMASLAAHEIGELAAIMGEATGLPEAGAEGCWNWLRQFTVDKPNFREAIPIALSHYRRRLKSRRMAPRDWQVLFRWCSERAEGQKSTTLDDDNDPGFPMLNEDGSVDNVSLRSLFADVPLKRTGFAFDLVDLPRECFALRPDDKFHELDESDNPRIGALVWAVGGLAREYKEALAILSHFPIPMDPAFSLKLTDIKAALRASNSATALAILFQDIRRENAKFEAWRTLYEVYEWQPESDAFSGNTAESSRSLRDWLRAIAHLMRDKEELWSAEVDDLFDELGATRGDDETGRAGVKRCLDLLCDMKVLMRVKGLAKYLRGPKAFSMHLVPPLPDTMPAGFFDYGGLGVAFSSDGRKFSDPSKTLRMLFHHEKEGIANPVLGRQIAQAFLDGEATSGTKFLAAFREGQSEPWLKALCQSFASDQLGLHDAGSWPSMIR